MVGVVKATAGERTNMQTTMNAVRFNDGVILGTDAITQQRINAGVFLDTQI